MLLFSKQEECYVSFCIESGFKSIIAALVFPVLNKTKNAFAYCCYFAPMCFHEFLLKHTYIVLGEQRDHQNKALRAAYVSDCINLSTSLSLLSLLSLLLQPFLTLLLQNFTKLTHRSLALSQPHGDALLEQALRLSNTLPVVFLYLRRPSATSSIEVFFAFRMEQAERGNKPTNV